MKYSNVLYLTAVFCLFVFSTILILYERFTPIYINSNLVRLGLYIISGTILTTAAARLLLGLKSMGVQVFILVLVSAICISKCYFSWGGDWKTQTILYTKINNPLQTVEFQMRADRFAFGYKKRIVKRERIAPFVDYVTDIDTAMLNVQHWKRIDKTVNRLKIKDFNDIPTN